MKAKKHIVNIKYLKIESKYKLFENWTICSTNGFIRLAESIKQCKGNKKYIKEKCNLIMLKRNLKWIVHKNVSLKTLGPFSSSNKKCQYENICKNSCQHITCFVSKSDSIKRKS